jgi:hypothetical protein
MQVSATTIVLGAAALGAIFALVIGRLRAPGSGVSRRSHILSASATLLIAVVCFVEAAISADERYVLIGIGSVLVVTAVVVLLNLRKHPTRR